MPIINPNEAQFRPQGQQRHGLLGNAPPGYNPMMGPRSFGPQGTVAGTSVLTVPFTAADSAVQPAVSEVLPMAKTPQTDTGLT